MQHSYRFFVSGDHDNIVVRLKLYWTLRAQMLVVGIRIAGQCVALEKVDGFEIDGFVVSHFDLQGRSLIVCSSLQINEGRNASFSQQRSTESGGNCIRGTKHSFKCHDTFEVSMEAVIGGEPDTCEHLLAMR